MLLGFGMPGGWEWLIIAGIGLLLFGRRLPEVGRSLGRGIVEFKKGIKGIEDEIEDASGPKPAASGAEGGGEPPALRSESQSESWPEEERRVSRAESVKDD